MDSPPGGTGSGPTPQTGHSGVGEHPSHCADSNGFRGSLDPAGYRLASGPGQAPRFEPIGVTYSDERWSDQFGPPGTDGNTYALAADSSGNLYAGGAFSTAGGVSASHIARWNSSSWSALGSGSLCAGGLCQRGR